MNGRGSDWAADFPIVSRWIGFSWLRSRRVHRLALCVVAGGILIAAAILELDNSWFQSLVFRAADSHITYTVAPGESTAILYPSGGPYDRMLGYSRMPEFIERLKSQGFRIEAQARDSSLYRALASANLYPVWSHKDVAGVEITDRNGLPIYSFKLPQRIYSNYDDIPPVVIQTLLLIENRQMLDAGHPYRNPAIEWDRFTKALLDYGVHLVDRRHPIEGGSTLATQLEKMRHSPGGRTHDGVEKLKQMASATLAAYQQGRTTVQTRREIVRSYLNSIPLAAAPDFGDVEGLGDGLWAWYGADASEVNALLRTNEATLSAHQMARRARAYREVLSLLLALRAPNHYLVEDPDALQMKTNKYLGLLSQRGVISKRLSRLALGEHVVPRSDTPALPKEDFVTNKAPNSVRMSLLGMLGLSGTYDLDRLDLSVRTTIDEKAQQGVAQFFKRIKDARQAGAAGLVGHELLGGGDPGNVVYSCTLYERGPGVNYLRVQTDNLNQPLNINQGTKLELGSTAKLRTLINYLEIVAVLHKKYADLPADELKSMDSLPDDHLTAWALQYLATAKDRSERAMLQAALERKYSANPGESFFTAGGVHHFENFDKDDNGRILTVREAFQRSVNLVFIRLMRDIVNYYRFRVPGASPAVLEHTDDPARRAYVARFADQEGRLFLGRFYEKYQGLTADQALAKLVHGVHMTPLRAAVIYRSIRPSADFDSFAAFLKANLPAAALARQDPAKLYEKYAIGNYNLSDRGYLAHVHPLELWLLNFREQHPGAHLKDIWAASTGQRQEVYGWLFKTHHPGAQDIRIRTLLEEDAFKEIHRAWKRQGYPFDSLVPSYATTIGVSGDTPAALAELMGILVNDGVRYPAIKISRLHFGQGTPTETVLKHEVSAGQRVIAPEIAALVRSQLAGVVQNGTARRARGAIVLANGQAVTIGGKTGTGDNRLESFSASGHEIGSKVVNRTAAFVFSIGDRFYGTIVAYVPGQKAAAYGFTSALAVQIFKDLAPEFKPLLKDDAPPDSMMRAQLLH